MSNFTGQVGRVKRTQRPRGKLTKHNYRERALPSLLIDFQNRCAYSMRHQKMADGSLDVDHFDPREKRNYLQRYNNLFLASPHCNGRKSDFWPTVSEERQGIRFLNCCKEYDYGKHIFEDPRTNEVFGVTPIIPGNCRRQEIAGP